MTEPSRDAQLRTSMMEDQPPRESGQGEYPLLVTVLAQVPTHGYGEPGTRQVTLLLHEDGTVSWER